MNLWNRVLEKLQGRLNPQNFATWFKPTAFHSLSGDTLFVTVPNEHFHWIAEGFSEDLARVFDELAPEVPDVDLRSLRLDFKTQASTSSDAQGTPARASVPSLGSPVSPAGSHLHPRYTFETFVVGNSNQFAHAAARRVAEAPATGYNPLFLYGGVGLGKTHLMHAIGHAILASRPRTRLTYISAERFMNEMIHAIRTERQLDFKNRYRRCDILLVDDIQFLQGKESTQEEFFHTFNELYESGRQIVLSSDRPPSEIQKIDERLKSRFEWGLRADIQLPELETKIAILHKKAEAERVNLAADVALYVASRVRSNIRELEGSLIRIIALASLTGRPIDLDLARESLSETGSDEDRPVTIARIQKYVAEYYELKPAELKSRSNQKVIAFPRQVAMWLCKKLTTASYPEIGREFGGKHHTTVIHSVTKIEAMRKGDAEFNRILNSLAESL
jgi:chromosomal replication initiator protein